MRIESGDPQQRTMVGRRSPHSTMGLINLRPVYIVAEGFAIGSSKPTATANGTTYFDFLEPTTTGRDQRCKRTRRGKVRGGNQQTAEQSTVGCLGPIKSPSLNNQKTSGRKGRRAGFRKDAQKLSAGLTEKAKIIHRRRRGEY